MLRKIGKGIGYVLAVLLVLIAGFTAFNWTLVSNIVAIGGAKVTEVSRFQPSQRVKGCTTAPLANDPARFPAANFAAMKAYSDRHGGVGLIVLRDGAVVGEAYRPGASAGTQASSQSMHKTVVGLMAGTAVAEGLIPSLDVPVGRYITEWKDDARGKIPLRRFLHMASGLHNPSMAKMELAALNLMMGDVTDAALGVAIERAPGQFNYQNIDYQIAGTVLSRAIKAKSRGDYAAWLSQKLWCPLGNADGRLWLEDEGGEARYFAYLDASVRDWARVGELIRNQGQWQGQQLVPAAHVAEFAAPSPGNPNYGMGIWRGSPWQATRRYSAQWDFGVQHSAAYLADDVLFLDGFGGQRVYIVPSAGLVISRSGETSMTWDDAQLVNIALKGLAGS
jgi:CubicO group peptidase (beta-lactamase class C family)